MTAPSRPPASRPPSWRRIAATVALLAAVGLAIGLVAGLSGGGRAKRPPPAPVPSASAPARTTPSSTAGAPAASGATAPPGAPALAAPAGRSFGANFNRLFNDGSYSRATIDAQLSAARSDGVRLARSDAFWELAEPRPPVAGVHQYAWSFSDSVAAALATHGLRWLAIMDYSAYWAESLAGSDHSAPTSSDAYAAYAAAFARRYGRRGEFWRDRPDLPARPVTTYEIWNEPDSAGFWAPAPDAARYIDLYLRARDAIKLVDPRARVLIGGLTQAPAFVPQLLSARPDARGHIDGVAVHPYSPTPLGVLAAVGDARHALDTLAMADVPLYVTEFGWVTSPSSSTKYASPALRPGYIAATTQALARTDCGVAAIVLYTWVTPERNPADEEDWYGIRHPDGRASPSSHAYAAAINHAGRPEARPRVRLCHATR